MKKMSMQIMWSALYVLFGSLVFVLGLNLLKILPDKFQDGYKTGLPILFLILYFVSQKYFTKQKDVLWAFFLVSVGWLIDFYFTGKIAARLSFDSKVLSGMAYSMVISTIMISAPVIIGWLFSNRRLATIYIQGSNKIWGLVVGVVGLLLFGGLGILQAQDQGMAFRAIGVAIPMALVFSLANAFREELVYRAVFLNGFQTNIGTLAAIIVTTLVFVLAHIEVNYDTASLVVFTIFLVIIGVVGSLIMTKTRSLIGAVLFHMGANVLLILGLLSSQQLIIN